MGNRKAFVESFLSDLDAICPGHGNEVFYRPFFDGLTDTAFEKMVVDIEAGKLTLPLILPNLSDALLNTERNIKLSDKWGHNFFQRLWLTDAADPEVVYLSNPTYLTGKVPTRRLAQTLEAGLSTPMDNSQTDELTGQVTGMSKSSAMTAPEVQILGNEKLYHTLEEFLNPRGGNNAGYQILEKSIIETGVGTLREAASAGTRVKGVETLSTLMTVAHLGNTL